MNLYIKAFWKKQVKQIIAQRGTFISQFDVLLCCEKNFNISSNSNFCGMSVFFLSNVIKRFILFFYDAPPVTGLQQVVIVRTEFARTITKTNTVEMLKMVKWNSWWLWHNIQRETRNSQDSMIWIWSTCLRTNIFALRLSDTCVMGNLGIFHRNGEHCY